MAIVSNASARGDVRRLALEAVDLADLEPVVAGAAVERGDGAVVVDGEEVVAAEAVDHEAAVDRGVVVDPLDGEGAGRHGDDAGRSAGGIGTDGGEVAVEDGDEGRPVGVVLVGARAGGAAAGDRRDLAQEHDVVDRVRLAGGRVDAVQWAVTGVDVGRVDVVRRRAGVDRVDDVADGGALRAVRVDHVDVALAHRRRGAACGRGRCSSSPAGRR